MRPMRSYQVGLILIIAAYIVLGVTYALATPRHLQHRRHRRIDHLRRHRRSHSPTHHRPHQAIAP
jgi:hypothetical protein